MVPGLNARILDTVITAAISFAATNIDDIFVLAMFYSQTGREVSTLKKWQVVAGQYLGFNALLGISLVGFFGGRVLSPAWMGCLGFVPIWIGLRRWFFRKKPAGSANIRAISTLSVAAVTFANGGDNIGVYTPLFASCNLSRLLVTLATFEGLLIVWCIAADAISHHPAVAPVLARYGHIIVPFVLVGLGVEIVVESGAPRLFGF